MESTSDKDRWRSWTCEKCKATKTEDKVTSSEIGKGAHAVTADSSNNNNSGSKKGPKLYECVECEKKGKLKDFYAKPCRHVHEPVRCLQCAFPKCHKWPFKREIKQGNEVDMKDKEKEKYR